MMEINDNEMINVWSLYYKTRCIDISAPFMINKKIIMYIASPYLNTYVHKCLNIGVKGIFSIVIVILNYITIRIKKT